MKVKTYPISYNYPHRLYIRGVKHATRGPHVSREGVLCGPRCFSGILKHFKFTLPSALENDAAK